MRRLLPRALVTAVPLWAVLAANACAAGGLGPVETVYVPTSSVVSVPTSYVVPSSYLLSTSYSYAVPTVYTSSVLTPTYYVSPSAYVVPSYVATGYTVSRRYVERPLVATRRVYTYYPTAWTTALDYPVVATSASYPVVDDCGTTVLASPAPAPAAPAAAPPAERRPSSTIDSVPANEPALNSTPSNSSSTPANPSPPPASGPTEPSSPPPATPAPEPGGEAGAPAGGTQTPAGGGATVPPASAPPVAPGASLNPESTRREAQRPKPPETLQRTAASYRNILEGRVLSRATGQAEEGVRLVFSDPMRRFEDRVVVSDALGRYAVSLADGDWIVSVQMPSGRLLAVNDIRITVSGGHIMNNKGREIPSLNITR